MPSFDTIAAAYEKLEKLIFAGRLQKARRFCLRHTAPCANGLLIGDGDGRFSTALLQTNPQIRLQSIDISPRMLALAKERAGTEEQRLETIHANILQHPLLPETYDFIGLHFCLDCFTQTEIAQLLPRLETSLKSGGILAYTDFQTRNVWHRLFVRFLYLCFRASAGLQTKRLPRVEWSANLTQIEQKQFLSGLVFSHVFSKASEPTRNHHLPAYCSEEGKPFSEPFSTSSVSFNSPALRS